MLITVQSLEDSPAVLSQRKIGKNKENSYEWKDKPLPTLTKDGTYSLQVGKCVPIVVLGVSVHTDRQQLRETESKMFQTGLQPVMEGLVEGESGSSGSGEAITKTLPPHIPARPSNKSGGRHNLFIHFQTDPSCEKCKRTRITRVPCRRSPAHREDRIPRATNFGDVVTADHKVLNEENESRLHHRCAAVVQDLATRTRHDEKFAAIPSSSKQAWRDWHSKFIQVHKSLRRLGLESRQVDSTSIRNKWNRQRSVQRSKKKGLRLYWSNQNWMHKVVRSDGLSLLSTKN